MTILDEKRADLEKYEFMMGTERGRLAVALDLLTDSLILTGQHGVYCISNRNPSNPPVDPSVTNGANPSSIRSPLSNTMAESRFHE